MKLDQAVRALGALAHPIRLTIFRNLVQAGPAGLAVGAIGQSLTVAPATLSFHLKELANADLITARQDGRFIIYVTHYEAMAALMGFLTENCCDGMPEACVARLETALSDCCAPRPGGRRSRSRSVA